MALSPQNFKSGQYPRAVQVMRQKREAESELADLRQLFGSALKRLHELGESSFDLDRPSRSEGKT